MTFDTIEIKLSICRMNTKDIKSNLVNNKKYFFCAFLPLRVDSTTEDIETIKYKAYRKKSNWNRGT